MIDPSDITGLVLAGGRGRRMGGVDKGLQAWRGRPLAEQAMIRLGPQVADIWVNANRHLTAYASFASQVCADSVPGFAGPLAGIVAGLQHCRTGHLAVVPCDSPAFPLDLVQRLADALVEAQADLATAAIPEDGGWRSQPVFCLMRVELMPRLLHDLAQGERKVGRWVSQQRQVLAKFVDPAAFANINTLAELQQLP